MCSWSTSGVTTTGHPGTVAPVDMSRATIVSYGVGTYSLLVVRSNTMVPSTPYTPQTVEMVPRFRLHTVRPFLALTAYTQPEMVAAYTRFSELRPTVTPEANRGSLSPPPMA